MSEQQNTSVSGRPIDDKAVDHLRQQIPLWAKALGFQHTGFSAIELSGAEQQLHQWLAKGYHGEMGYMAEHGNKRSRPAELIEGTCSIISLRMDYLPDTTDAEALLQQRDHAYISRYALGRDYHKLMRQRLQRLAKQIEAQIGAFGYRVFVDSAPVLEKPIAQQAGLGWIGKHTNLINKTAGSWFFLGEIYTDLPLAEETTPVTQSHCGTCRSCIDACPTDAIVAPYELDARRCISYLTIELHGSIPLEFRKAIGNRIYGCDDCQLVCPWNRFAQYSQEADFRPRHQLDSQTLLQLFAWDEATFLNKMQGSAIRRIGHLRWLRNIAVALGNAETTPELIDALQSRRNIDNEMLQEHIDWALQQHQVDKHG